MLDCNLNPGSSSVDFIGFVVIMFWGSVGFVSRGDPGSKPGFIGTGWIFVLDLYAAV